MPPLAIPIACIAFFAADLPRAASAQLAGSANSGNSLTLTAASGWGNAGAASTQSIAAADGYVETTANQLYTYRMFGLSNGNTNQTYEDIDFALYLAWDNLYVYESGAYRAYVGTYALGDVLRVSVEGGVVKYRKNGTLLYTSTGAPTYPLLVDTALHTNGATLDNVVISGAGGGGGTGAEIKWLVTDQLGTPRIVLNQTGSLAATSRHDYLPFGEELFAGQGGRTTAQGYSASDGVRQQFTLKERDNETGLDYFGARYLSSTQGRFTGCDPKLLGIKQVVNPQRWNRYAYVVNNPLALYDPDGQDDQGQGGGKVIDVFIAIPPDRQQDYRTVNGRPAGNYPSPDWSKLQENAAKAGYTVNVHQMSESTPEAVANSLKNSELTVIVGHGIDMTPTNPTKFTADAAALSGGLIGVGGTQPATMEGNNIVATGEATPVSGTGAVGLFTCNSTDVLSSAFPNQTVVSNDGGPDGLTTVGTLQQAAFGFVGTYVDTGGNVNAATATGQRVINNASNRVVNEPAANGGRATNAGDTLHIRVRRREEE